MSTTTPRLPVETLAKFAADAFMTSGVSAGDAAKAAHFMLESDLAGQDGHGIFRLAQNINYLRAGRVKHPSEPIAEP